MNSPNHLRNLKIALIVFGLFCIFGIYIMTNIWPGGWLWEPQQPEYEQMIMGVYAILGIFLLIAAREPNKHKSLIWFTVWSSIVHGGIMAVQAFQDPRDRINLLGDVPSLFIMAFVLTYLMIRAKE